jgi:AraC-like DNA-binding protein
MIPNARWSAGDYRLTPKPRLVTATAGDAAIHDLFMRCAEVFAGYDKYRFELLETLLKEIYIRLAEHWEGGRSRPVSARIHPMITYLRSNLSRRVTRRDLACVFKITPEHVNALFRKELGVTPTQFIHRERVMLAYRHIRDRGLSVKEVAAMVGFDDPFYFSRVFKRIMKRSPASILRRKVDKR